MHGRDLMILRDTFNLIMPKDIWDINSEGERSDFLIFFVHVLLSEKYTDDIKDLIYFMSQSAMATLICSRKY